MRRTSKTAAKAGARVVADEGNAVAERERFLSAMCESTADGLIATDRNRIVTFLNPAAQALTGWREEETLGRDLIHIFNITDEEKGNSTESLAMKALREGTVVSVSGGMTLIAKDGTAHRILGDIVPVINDKGEIAGVVLAFRGIADDQGVAEELRRSEERYRLLFDNYGDPISIYSIDGALLMVNSVGAKNLGGKREDLVGKSIYDLHPEQASGYVEGFRQIAMSGKAVDSEGEVEMPSGKRWFWSILQPLRDESGEVYAVQIVSHDITQRKQAEEALRASNHKYRTLLENLPQKIFLKDRNSIYISCNKNYSDDLNIRPDEIVGRTDYDFFPKELAEKYRADDERIVKSGETKELEETYTQDGREVTVHTVKTPVRDENGSVFGVLGIFWDITERKQAEERLLKSEERLRLMFESVMDGISVTDAEGVITDVNERLVEMYGFSTKKEMLGKSSTELIARRDREKVTAVWQKGIPEEAVRYECSVVRADGSEFPVEASSGALRDRQGRVIGFIGITRDTTKRKRAEDALRESERRYRLLSENVSDVITSVDMNGRAIYISPSITRLLGYSVEEAMNRPPEQSMTPASARAAAKSLTRSVAGDTGEQGPQSRSHTQEFEFYRKDGSTVWAEVSWSIVRDSHGQPREIVSVLRDITKRKQAEDLFRTLFNSSPIGAYIVQDGKFQVVNSRFEELTGYTKGELHGVHSLDLVFPGDRSMVREDAIKMLRGKPSPMYEFRMVNKAGQIRWVMEKATSIQYQGQRATLGALMDITERRQAEQKLQEAYEEEKRLRSELEGEIKKRVEFARALVHELKTPLTSVIASSELLASELPEGPLLRMARNISRSADNLNKRVDELFDVARGELGMLQLSLTSVDPLPLLQELADEMSPVALNRQQSLALDLPPSLPPAWADADRLRQVVFNLLGNACKFTDEGGRITLRARGEGDKLIVEVEDTGPGIGEEEQQQLFTTYYRVEGNGKRSRGLGLGLALCKTLVELHGGQIWVKSKKGVGSTFGFSVPLAGASQLNGVR